MITQDGQFVTDANIPETNNTYYGLSTDSKPVDGVGNGSCFIEMNTGKVYFFDEANSQWHEFS